MSTRWYPIYQRGNPQLRVFLPDFWMKLIKPTEPQPKNVVTFSVSMQMTKYDVQNYLTKIYKLPVVDVRTRIALGKTKQDVKYGYVTKEDDMKIAYVTLVRVDCSRIVLYYSILILLSFFLGSQRMSSSRFPIYLNIPRKRSKKRRRP